MKDRTGNLLGALSLLVADRIRIATADEVGESGMAAAALVLLTNLRGPSIETLAASLGISHSGTVRLVDRLEADDFLVKRQGPDARTAAIFLTSAGRRKANRVAAARRTILQAQLDRLDDNQITQLTGILETLLEGTEATSRWHVCRLCDVDTCEDPFCPTVGGLQKPVDPGVVAG